MTDPITEFPIQTTDFDELTSKNILVGTEQFALQETGAGTTLKSTLANLMIKGKQYELGSQVAAASHPGIAAGFIIRTSYITSARTLGSGSNAAYTGSGNDDVGQAGKWFDTADDGFGYDADGKQFSIGLQANVLQFGLLGDDATDDFTPLAGAIAWLVGATGRTLDFVQGATYIVSDRTAIDGAANFTIHGNGAIIKAEDGMVVEAGKQILFWTSCTDGNIYDLNVDSNRAGRTPIESSSHGIQVYTSCARLKFFNCKSDNATTDGWSLDSATPTVLASIPTDITLSNCSAKNAFRGNLSLINSVRFRDFNGVYKAATGTAPQHGIDCEPNDPGDQGNQDARFYNTTTDDNVGAGFLNQIANSEVRIYDMVSNSNGVAGIRNSGGYMEVHGASFDGYTDTITLAVAESTIDAGTTIFNDLVFSDIVLTGSRSCVNTGGANGGALHQIVNGLSGSEIAAAILRGTAKLHASNISFDKISGEGSSQIIMAGVQSSLREVTLRQDATGDTAFTSIEISAADCIIDGVNLVNPGVTSGGTLGAIGFVTNAVRGTCRNVSITQTVGIPAGQVGVKFTEIPLIAENISCRSAGTDYTSANSITFTAGRSGARISNIRPNVVPDTWTPVLKDSTTVIGITITYATFVQANGLIHIRAAIVRNDAASLTATLNLSGFPVFVSSTSLAPSGGALFDNVANDITALLFMNSATQATFINTDGVTGSKLITTDDWENGRALYISATYMAD